MNEQEQQLNAHYFKITFTNVSKEISFQQAENYLNHNFIPFNGLTLSMNHNGLTINIEKKFDQIQLHQFKQQFLTRQNVELGKLGKVSVGLEMIDMQQIEGSMYSNKNKKNGKSSLMRVLFMVGILSIIVAGRFLVSSLSSNTSKFEVEDHNIEVEGHNNKVEDHNNKQMIDNQQVRRQDDVVQNDKNYVKIEQQSSKKYVANFVQKIVLNTEQSRQIPINKQQQQIKQQKITKNALKKQKNRYEIQIQNIKYEAIIKIRPKVTDMHHTWAQKYEYLRPTQSQIITFPQQQWEEDKEQKLRFTELIEEEERNLMIQEMHLTKRKRSYLDYMFYNNINQHPDKKAFQQAEYEYLNQKYLLDHKQYELPFCIISHAYNLVDAGSHDRFLHSMDQQNYTNFHIYLIDDASTDSTTLKMYSLVAEEYPRLKRRITFIRNQQKIGAFASKDSAIKENCREDSFVVQVNGNDWLIGRQALNLVNSMYIRNPNIWVLYSGNIIKKSYGKDSRGDSEIIPVKSYEYRNSAKKFVSRHLKTYWAGLQMKIPINYLTFPHNVNGEQIQKYPESSEDEAIMYSLIQMAGDSRVYYLKQLIYYYHRNKSDSSCDKAIEKLNEGHIKILKPLKEFKTYFDQPTQDQTIYNEDIALIDIKGLTQISIQMCQT